MITAVPGPESLRLAGELRRYESRNVTYLAEAWPVFWERASGVNVWDVDGNIEDIRCSLFFCYIPGLLTTRIVKDIRIRTVFLVVASNQLILGVLYFGNSLVGFFDMMDDVSIGRLVTVPVTSRRAYIFLSAGTML